MSSGLKQDWLPALADPNPMVVDLRVIMVPNHLWGSNPGAWVGVLATRETIAPLMDFQWLWVGESCSRVLALQIFVNTGWRPVRTPIWRVWAPRVQDSRVFLRQSHPPMSRITDVARRPGSKAFVIFCQKKFMTTILGQDFTTHTWVEIGLMRLSWARYALRRHWSQIC